MAIPIRQLLSQTSYSADGVDTVWNFSFASGYIDKSHVKAYYTNALKVRTVVPVTLGMFSGPNQLTITPAIPAGTTLTIYRDTPKDAPLVDFIDRAAFTEVSLDLATKQAVFASAEASDGLAIAIESVDTIVASVNAAAASAGASASSRDAAAASASTASAALASANTRANDALTSANNAAASALSVSAANLVQIAGAQTITGAKTFSAASVFNAGVTVVGAAFSGAVTGLTKAMVGLANVDNTTDAGKPVSTAQQASINSAQATASAVTSTLTSLYAESIVSLLVNTINGIPLDDTTPQVTEGVQILSLTITPKSATTKLRLRFQTYFSGGGSGSSTSCSCAAFVNGAANAVSASAATNHTTTATASLTMEYQWTPGTTTAQTITIRVGPGIAGNSITLLAGTGVARMFGGVGRSTLVVDELS